MDSNKDKSALTEEHTGSLATCTVCLVPVLQKNQLSTCTYGQVTNIHVSAYFTSWKSLIVFYSDDKYIMNRLL